MEKSLQQQKGWESDLSEFRRGKDAFYQSGDESPIPRTERHLFTGLKYYPADPKLRFEVKLHRYNPPEIVTMTTSKGTRQRFHRVGYFELEMGGNHVKVQAYKSAEREDNDVFVPFKDATSGIESYGSARYLDLEERPDDQYVVDFNYAYNPYCAYSDDYICPFPPKENWLDVSVRAGEMKYHD
jgi:uncharacterized protein (DUF1684 family)